jgi:hypothetical protein
VAIGLSVHVGGKQPNDAKPKNKMKATLHFETRATRTLDSVICANSTAAAAWCVGAVMRHAQICKVNGSEIFFSVNRNSFVTDGGDEAEAQWNWVSDEVDAPIVAELRVRDM